MKKIVSIFLVWIFSFSSIFSFVHAESKNGKIMFWSGNSTKNLLQDVEKNAVNENRSIYDLSTKIAMLAHLYIGWIFINSSPKRLVMIVGVGCVSGGVIAVVGKSYISRSRDISRIGGLANILLALSTYHMDHDDFPKVPQSGCIPEKELKSWYINIIPTDPKKGRINYGCIDPSRKNSYAYRVIKQENKKDIAILSATMENIKYGNSPYSIDQIVKTLRLLEKVEKWEFKGKWKYYIISTEWY